MDTFDAASPFVRAYAPGRTELAGNHTDHQGGRVIAAALDCGIQMDVQPAEGMSVRVDSAGFAPVELDISECAPRPGETGTTAALVRGVVAGLRSAGVPVGGFRTRVSSDIPAGGGLSSSAAFELALASALVCMAHPSSGEASGERVFSPVELARIGQAAERAWFGKPCGLMDQLACALGGICLMDFSGLQADPPGDGSPDCAGDEATSGVLAEESGRRTPVSYERIPFDFEAAGYALVLVDTHCDHSRYTNEYAQVARDMTDVAAFFGRSRLVEVAQRDFLGRMDEVRAALGDLSALRALHFYLEMGLVDERARALRAGDMNAFLSATRRSGASSAQYLQNVSTAERESQPAMVALGLADLLAGEVGAVRIHGGGFGGSIQAFVPTGAARAFAQELDSLLGAGSTSCYRIAEKGAHATWLT